MPAWWVWRAYVSQTWTLSSTHCLAPHWASEVSKGMQRVTKGMHLSSLHQNLPWESARGWQIQIQIIYSYDFYKMVWWSFKMSLSQLYKWPVAGKKLKLNPWGGVFSITNLWLLLPWGVETQIHARKMVLRNKKKNQDLWLQNWPLEVNFISEAPQRCREYLRAMGSVKQGAVGLFLSRPNPQSAPGAWSLHGAAATCPSGFSPPVHSLQTQFWAPWRRRWDPDSCGDFNIMGAKTAIPETAQWNNSQMRN